MFPRIHPSQPEVNGRMEQAATNLDELYTAHSVYLNKFMLKLTRNQEEAADLVQEIFLRLCQKDNLPEHPKEWLSLTGYRLFVDQWRRKQRCSRLPLDHTFPTHNITEHAVLDREFERLVRLLLLRLNPLSRSAIHLRVFEQRSYGEISRLLGCSENTIKSCIRRGRAQLSRWL
jgi:RNA polymerase sigma factor (sigma-70 family)